jgi:group I intron endonuclease
MTAQLSGVYRINVGNGRFYIGSAVNLSKRKWNHLSALRSGRHYNSILQNSFDKYGEFDFSVVERCQVDQVIAREQVLLDEHFNDPKCANIAPTAGSSIGRKASAQARANMSASHQNRSTISAEHREKLSAAKLGKRFSLETRARMSAAQTGKKRSPEVRAKMSAAQSARWEQRRAADYEELLDDCETLACYGGDS